MDLKPNKTVREFAAETPHAALIFEEYGIDYCCGGSRTLQAACQQANIDVADVLRNFESLNPPPRQGTRKYIEWRKESLTDLISHILATHHAYVRREIPRLKQLLFEVVAVHCAHHPELAAVQRTFAGLAGALAAHMSKEERALFPYIQELERAKAAGKPAPSAPFGSISNPVRMMEQEHESAGKALREMDWLTAAYTPPHTACFSYRTLYSALRDFEADLRLHIHLENNILSPRAIRLENSFADVCG